jgi:hypothetical protein
MLILNSLNDIRALFRRGSVNLLILTGYLIAESYDFIFGILVACTAVLMIVVLPLSYLDPCMCYVYG